MPITGANKAKESFYRYVIEHQERARETVITLLNTVGLQCVEEARSHPKYKDRTGNLRSSIGYVVLEDGVTIRKSGFDKVLSTATEAQSKSNALIARLAATYNKGLVLVVVAGMNYATYVESKGLNVLNSAKTLGKTLVPRMLKELGLKK